jgi:hypothetical protein
MWKVVESHGEFVTHGWLAPADRIGLPQRGDLGVECVFLVCGEWRSQRQPVKLGQGVGNPALRG